MEQRKEIMDTRKHGKEYLAKGKIQQERGWTRLTGQHNGVLIRCSHTSIFRTRNEDHEWIKIHRNAQGVHMPANTQRHFGQGLGTTRRIRNGLKYTGMHKECTCQQTRNGISDKDLGQQEGSGMD